MNRRPKLYFDPLKHAITYMLATKKRLFTKPDMFLTILEYCLTRGLIDSSYFLKILEAVVLDYNSISDDSPIKDLSSADFDRALEGGFEMSFYISEKKYPEIIKHYSNFQRGMKKELLAAYIECAAIKFNDKEISVIDIFGDKSVLNDKHSTDVMSDAINEDKESKDEISDKVRKQVLGFLSTDI